MGVRYIKIIFKPSFSVGIVEHRDAGSAFIDPAAKLPVPFVQF